MVVAVGGGGVKATKGETSGISNHLKSCATACTLMRLSDLESGEKKTYIPFLLLFCPSAIENVKRINWSHKICR